MGLCLLLMSCGTQNQREGQTTAEPEKTAVASPAATDSTNKEISIYSIDDDSLESVEETVNVPAEEELTAKIIVDKVVEAFGEHDIEIGIYSVTQKDDNVYISFTKDKAPSATVGSSVEGTILDSMAKSVLDNVESCNNIIYRMEDDPYASGHIELEYDEVYLWK